MCNPKVVGITRSAQNLDGDYSQLLHFRKSFPENALLSKAIFLLYRVQILANSTNTERLCLEDFQKILSASSQSCSDFLRKAGELVYVEYLPKLYLDSTHHIYKLWFSQSPHPYICKLCLFDNRCPTKPLTPFWQQMQRIFDLSPCNSLQMVDVNRNFLKNNGVYLIPDSLFERVVIEPMVISLVLAEYIEGMNCKSHIISKEKYAILATHLLKMHACCFQREGDLATVLSCGESFEQSPKNWWQKIESVVTKLPAGKVDEDDRSTVLQNIQLCCDDAIRFVPLVVDFRWDQILKRQTLSTNEYFLIDLDALVSAPIELDWLMLELVLSEQEFAKVRLEYEKETSLPDVSRYRLIYRMVLYSMEILGSGFSWQEFKSLPARF